MPVRGAARDMPSLLPLNLHMLPDHPALLPQLRFSVMFQGCPIRTDLTMTNDGYSKLKTYVDVDVRFGRDGSMRPSAIIWEDGKSYEIDDLLDMRAAFSAKAGGHGDMYLIRIGRSICRLFFERNPYRGSGCIGRWFVTRVSDDSSSRPV